MAGGEDFNLAEEFAAADFHEERLEERFRRTMETLSKDPGKSILASSASRAEAKAIYNLLGNEKFDREEIIRARREGTIRRMEGQPVILAVQDTAGVNYDSRRETEGLGYISDKTMGVNIHTCLAVTPEGLVLGALDQTGYNRKEAKNTSLTKEQRKNRPIAEKESNRRLTAMERANRGIPETVKLIHVCDREGDIYELFDDAVRKGFYFLVRISENRITAENRKIPDEIRGKEVKGRQKARIPRDTRRGLKERGVVLQIRHASFEIQKPQIKNKNKELPPSLKVIVVYVKEEAPPPGVEPIEWFLMANEEVTGAEGAYEKAEYYIRRRKIGRFHHVLKSGRRVEELRERTMEKMKTLILMYSVTAVFIMNLTYLGRINPELSRAVLFDEDGRKLLYCLADTKAAPAKACSVKEAVDYAGWIGGPERAPGGGPPGVKTVWTGLQKFYTLFEYRDMFSFAGQV
ncbi:MAG: IS4-like element ISLpn5 family transposase [Treponemataceae bacterium]|nr:MAG: IS4-like element ISLpn5 family transposase [Treponemataceae bacterium]